MEVPSRLIVIDGTNIFWRAYHGLSHQNLTDVNGNPTGAIYGSLTTISSVVRDLGCSHLLVVYDWGKSSQRLAVFADYKGNRIQALDADLTEDAVNQLSKTQALLELMGLKIYREKNVEADDIIAKVCRSINLPTVVVSGDKDLRQLIKKRVRVLHPPLGKTPGKMWTHGSVMEHYGLPPSKLPEVWALTGDKSDNVPGVPGIGEATALKLMHKYGSLASIFISDEKKVLGHKNEAKLSHYLVTLHPELSKFSADSEDLRFRPVLPSSRGADTVEMTLKSYGFEKPLEMWRANSLWTSRGKRLGRK